MAVENLTNEQLDSRMKYVESRIEVHSREDGNLKDLKLWNQIFQALFNERVRRDMD